MKMRAGVASFFSNLLALVWSLALIAGALGVGIHVFRELDVVALSRWAGLPNFLSVPLQRQGDNLIIVTLAGVIAGLLVLFVGGYVWQALWDGVRLRLVRRSLIKRLGRLNDPEQILPDAWSWFYYPHFTRLWREYAAALHLESRLDPRTGLVHPHLLATIPPEMVFNQQSLVDLPMRIEFFRHLPGILTGSGIVSTFAGILMGLTGFDPAVGADQVTRELQGLFMGVSTAFSASFFAILTAMLVTVIEKILLHWRYGQVLVFQGEVGQQISRQAVGVEPAVTSVVRAPVWDEPVQKIIDSVARLEPLLTREQIGREESTLAISLNLNGVMATVERALESWVAYESKRRDEERSAWTTLERHLTAMDQNLRHEIGLQADVKGVGERMAGLLERQMSLWQEGLKQHKEQNAALMRLIAVSEGLDQRLDRLQSWMADEWRQQQASRAAQEERLAAWAERLTHQLERLQDSVHASHDTPTTGYGLEQIGQQLDQQLSWMREDTAARQVSMGEIVQGLEQLDDRLRQQLNRWREESTSRRDGVGQVHQGLERLGAELQQQLTGMQQQFARANAESQSVAHGLEQLGRQMDHHLTRMFDAATLPQEDLRAVVAGVGTLEKQLQQQLDQMGRNAQARQADAQALLRVAEQVEKQQQEIAARLESFDGVAAGVERLGGQLEAQLACLRDGLAVGQQGQTRLGQGLAHLATQLEQQLEEMRTGSAGQRAGVAVLESGMERLGERLGERLERQLTWLEQESSVQREAAASRNGRLVESLQGIDRQLERQGGELSAVAARHPDWVRRAEEGMGALRALMERIDAQGHESRQFRDQALETGHRLTRGVTELHARIPSGTEMAGWIRDALAETGQAAEGRHARLHDRLRTGHAELLARVEAGVVAMEAVRADGSGLLRLLEAVSRRLEGLQGGWREGMSELAERVAQATQAMDATLREVLLKVERAAGSSEEGMATLFGEMGREMERMRRQMRESAGHVAAQTREWLLATRMGGEENLHSLMKGVSEEFKSAVSTLVDERAQLDGDREAAMVERLLSQTAEQAEGVKMAVLGELDETAKQLTEHLRVSGEELERSREETSREVVRVIAERVETAFGGVAQELSEMRKRLVAEQKAMENALQLWVNEAARSTVEENRVLAQRLMEVQSHFEERHQGVIHVIDQLGKGLEQDLEQLRDGLYHKNEESSRHVEQHLNELGQLLEGVVTSLGREQSVFIEMLGERLESLRRRLRVK
ncbi:MAG: hypothetical protein G8237_02440 [Magnetococcales bacterium]|nr:hypothetical protein [Magnetococcales bacterium]